MATCLSAFGAPFTFPVIFVSRVGRRPWPVDEVYALAVQHTRISPSMLHRRLRIPRAKGEKYLQELEREGIVGPREGLGSREVLQGINGLP